MKAVRQGKHDYKMPRKINIVCFDICLVYPIPHPQSLLLWQHYYDKFPPYAVRIFSKMGTYFGSGPSYKFLVYLGEFAGDDTPRLAPQTFK